jgi:RNA polymerase sigma factor (TIGR02999 family)
MVPSPTVSDVTRLLEAAGAGGQATADELLPHVYEELRRLAKSKLALEQTGHTLATTDLVHEAWQRLVPPGREDLKWNGRRHFFGAAAEAMRRVLIDYARKKNAGRRGRGWERVTLGDHAAPVDARLDEVIDLDAALAALERDDPDEAELAKPWLRNSILGTARRRSSSAHWTSRPARSAMDSWALAR